MSKLDDGGPAFSWNELNSDGTPYSQHAGMSLRDHFAGLAMSTTFYPAIQEAIRTGRDLDCGTVAKFAYLMADAMLAERAK